MNTERCWVACWRLEIRSELLPEQFETLTVIAAGVKISGIQKVSYALCN